MLLEQLKILSKKVKVFLGMSWVNIVDENECLTFFSQLTSLLPCKIFSSLLLFQTKYFQFLLSSAWPTRRSSPRCRRPWPGSSASSANHGMWRSRFPFNPIQSHKVTVSYKLMRNFNLPRTSQVINVRCTGTHNLSFHGLKQREIELVKAQHVSRGMRRSFWLVNPMGVVQN